MSTATGTGRTKQPAIDGWFADENGRPHLIGNQCTTCGSYFFPRATAFCRNPTCPGTEFSEVELANRGKIWSYTDARYKPPPPYIVPTDEHVPFAIAAVELAKEGLVVLGQVVAGVSVDELRVGQEVELVIDTLYSDDDHDYQVWKWAPLHGTAADRGKSK